MHLILRWGFVAVGLLSNTVVSLVAAEDQRPVEVWVVESAGGWRLLRDGKPYVIKGAGGSASLKALAEAGGNSVRTWGPENAGALLDEAQGLGITVTLGIWLGHERHGFRYNDADQVAGQLEKARQTILRYKDHPALLMWGLGNEMEGYEKGDNAAIWSAVNSVAALAKKLDPNHPTMTVIAEIGGDKVKNVHRLCPAIDVVGINSYGGAATLPQRYKQAGGVKPFVLTEFGPAGSWEVAKTAWGAAIEATSTDKAAFYGNVYQQVVVGHPETCLGSYAFVWGHKQESTATWFGLFLADGTRTGAVDTLSELWSGRPPANHCPTVKPLKYGGPKELAPGATVHVDLAAEDQDKDPLKARWELRQEGTYSTGGDAEVVPPEFPSAVVSASPEHAELRMPEGGGGYRIYAYIYDNHGGAATANLPLFVKGPVKMPKAKTPALPLVVYEESDRPQGFAPAGWMGNQKAIKLNPACAEEPHSGKTCIRVDYQDTKEWGGVVWQSPANDWGNLPGGFDLTGATRLTFWARGAKGGEVVGFEFGLLGRDKKFFDTASGKLARVTLGPEWTLYSLDLAGKDLSRIKTGFCWTLAADGQPVTFFLDDIRFE
ncbi:MAG: glycoside hydrolase family 2 TIM barrel-domain containing protein [Isosphaeraceae bacterium]|nr:glycoside hydrolase family 2 TIM barrel-domain containing protein [Isosphaeraceae bacterium]